MERKLDVPERSTKALQQASNRVASPEHEGLKRRKAI